MPSFGLIKRSDSVRALRRAGFEGPYSGGKHQFMLRGTLSLTLPNPHQGEISMSLLNRILKQACITKEEWEAL